MIRFLSTRMVFALSALFLIGYWLLLLAFGDPSDPLNITKNAVSFLDLFVLGRSHLYQHGIIPFDPEGILSTIPAIVNVVVGYYAGTLMQNRGKGYKTISKLVLVGCLFVFLALCWNITFPINKKLWTSSFVLLTTGLDLVILSALIFIIELRSCNKWNWASFFTTLGKNPLFIYLVSELLFEVIDMIKVAPGFSFNEWINKKVFQQIAPGPIGSLFFSLCFMLVCWLIAWLMDKRRIYIRV